MTDGCSDRSTMCVRGQVDAAKGTQTVDKDVWAGVRKSIVVLSWRRVSGSEIGVTSTRKSSAIALSDSSANPSTPRHTHSYSPRLKSVSSIILHHAQSKSTPTAPEANHASHSSKDAGEQRSCEDPRLGERIRGLASSSEPAVEGAGIASAFASSGLGCGHSSGRESMRWTVDGVLVDDFIWHGRPGGVDRTKDLRSVGESGVATISSEVKWMVPRPDKQWTKTWSTPENRAVSWHQECPDLRLEAQAPIRKSSAIVHGRDLNAKRREFADLSAYRHRRLLSAGPITTRNHAQLIVCSFDRTAQTSRHLLASLKLTILSSLPYAIEVDAYRTRSE
ncbi:hypothetical protein A0H81_10323 [Grifola frondosa]|uniref:Uncharacterized protein n=1 Tax=Grifola frondosa TaxID=5627 RepID=A0A1C7LY12_GRIFR|nr:hypothetical protein A0H81_10323 [Grifola frondosa]